MNDSMLSDRERLIRAAAYIETEGSISLKKGAKYIMLQVRMASCTLELLEWMRDSFGGTIQPKTYQGEGVRKPSYDWVLSSKPAGVLLAAILPFLLIKREQAELAIRLRQVQGRHLRNVPLEDKMRAWQPYYDEMKRLNNARGGRLAG